MERNAGEHMRGKSIESHVWHVGVSGGRADSLDNLKLLNGPLLVSGSATYAPTVGVLVVWRDGGGGLI